MEADDDFKEIQNDVKRKVSTAEGRKRGRTEIAHNVMSTRCDTFKGQTSPKATVRGNNEF
jgi:hypothetical protein